MGKKLSKYERNKRRIRKSMDSMHNKSIINYWTTTRFYTIQSSRQSTNYCGIYSWNIWCNLCLKDMRKPMNNYFKRNTTKQVHHWLVQIIWRMWQQDRGIWQEETRASVILNNWYLYYRIFFVGIQDLQSTLLDLYK